MKTTTPVTTVLDFQFTGTVQDACERLAQLNCPPVVVYHMNKNKYVPAHTSLDFVTFGVSLYPNVTIIDAQSPGE